MVIKRKTHSQRTYKIIEVKNVDLTNKKNKYQEIGFREVGFRPNELEFKLYVGIK